MTASITRIHPALRALEQEEERSEREFSRALAIAIWIFAVSLFCTGLVFSWTLTFGVARVEAACDIRSTK